MNRPVVAKTTPRPVRPAASSTPLNNRQNAASAAIPSPKPEARPERVRKKTSKPAKKTDK
jgi:hypothetical protein